MTLKRNQRVFLMSLALSIQGMAFAQDTTDKPASGSTGSPGVVQRAGDAVGRGAQAAADGVDKGAKAAASGVERGVKAAKSGVKRGYDATARGVKRGAKAAAGGVQRGAQATANAAGKVADKVKGKSSSEPPSKAP